MLDIKLETVQKKGACRFKVDPDSSKDKEYVLYID